MRPHLVPCGRSKEQYAFRVGHLHNPLDDGVENGSFHEERLN